MKKQSKKTRRSNAARVLQHRLLRYLEAIAPDTPIPLFFIEQLVSLDMMTEGPFNIVLKNIAASHRLVNDQLDSYWSYHSAHDDRGTLTVSAQQRQAIRSALETMGHDTSFWAGIGGKNDILMMCVGEFNTAATLQRDEYSHDQKALLGNHGLYWLEQVLKLESEDGAGCAMSILEGLLYLVEDEALAMSCVEPYIEAVVRGFEKHRKRFADNSASDPLVYYHLLAIVELIFDLHAEGLDGFIRRMLEVCLESKDADVCKYARRLQRKARRQHYRP